MQLQRHASRDLKVVQPKSKSPTTQATTATPTMSAPKMFKKLPPRVTKSPEELKSSQNNKMQLKVSPSSKGMPKLTNSQTTRNMMTTEKQIPTSIEPK